MGVNSTYGCSFDISPVISLAYFGIPVCIIIVAENLLGMVTIWRSPKLHTNANVFIFSLAAADVNVASAFLFVCCVKLPALTSLFPDTKALDCFLIGETSSMVMLSCVHMAIIAVDRYIYIAHPFYYIRNVTRSRVLKTILLVWIAFLTYEFVPLAIYNDAKYHKKCILIFPPIEYGISNDVIYSATVATICISYFKIARLATRHSKSSSARRHLVTERDAIFWNKKTRAAMMKSVKFFMILFGVFFVCTTLPALVLAINVFVQELPYLFRMAYSLLVMNSGANFVIYAHMSKDFRQAVKKTLLHLTWCCHRQ